MQGKRKTALGNAASCGTVNGIGIPLTHANITRSHRCVKSRVPHFDVGRSRALDHAADDVESSHEIARGLWQIRKRWLESRFAELGQ
jgi:hypothetical protein